MKQAFWTRSPVLLALVVAIASPAIAQNAGDKAAEARLRKIEAEVKALQRQVFPGGDGKTVGETLLTPTRIYAKTVAALVAALGDDLRALSHITGGGLPENLPRVLPAGLGARLELGSYERPLIFRVIAEGGPVEAHEMARTFNLGVGLCVVVAKDAADRAIAALEASGEKAWRLGAIEARENGERVALV